MMKDDRRLDDFFRKKLGERKPTFDAASWEKMDALLGEKPKKKRRGLFIWLLGIAGLFLLLGTWSSIFYTKKTITATEDRSLLENETEKQINLVFENEDEKDNENENRNEKVLEPITKQEEIGTRETDDKKVLRKKSLIFNEVLSEKEAEDEIIDKTLTSNNESKNGNKDEKQQSLISKGLGQINLLEISIPKELEREEEQIDLPLIEESIVKKESRPIRFAALGGTKHYTRQTSQGNQWGMGWELGMELEKPISEKWAIGSGFSMYQRKKFANQDSETQVTAGMPDVANTGVFISEIVSTPSEDMNLTYLKLPLFVRYQWNEKSSIRAGLWGSYLLAASGDLLQYEFVTNMNTNESNKNNLPILKASLENLPDYNRVDLGLEAQYEFQFTERWRCYVGMSYGLSAVFQNSNNLLEQMDSGGTLGSSPSNTSPSNVQGRQVYLDVGLRLGF